jgi:hypothetical protein
MNTNNNNNNKFENILKVFSSTQISLLSDVNKTINVNTYGEFKYFNIFRCNVRDIENFVLNLDSSKIYTVIPILSINKSFDDPYIILSKQLLITKYSSPLIVHEFLMTKYHRTDELFEIGDLQYFWLTLKYKPVEFDFENYRKFISK